MPERVLRSPGTAEDRVTGAPEVSQTNPAAATLTAEIGGFRSISRDLNERLSNLQQRSHLNDWAKLTNARARSGTKTLLDELAALGFAWTDVARMIGVSVPALQKWRRGEGVTGTNRQRVASLLAACDLIGEYYLIEEIASWFEMPITLGVPVTPVALWVEGRQDLVFELASGHADAEQVLDSWDSEWRERFRSEFEVFVADDGQRSLRPRTS
ncbi:MAG: hypothetical protein ACT4QF_22415 [Sporichthyaceae bacterium]